MENLTIVTCYEAGTEELLRVWMTSVIGHTVNSGIPFKIVVLVRNDQDEGLLKVVSEYNAIVPISVVMIDAGLLPATGSRLHGRMLDHYIPSRIETSRVMTMDTDCFPIANGWMNNLFGLMDAGVKIVGVLHPWAPPPESLDKKTIEYRMRSQQCWLHTHVACQMMKTDDLRELNIRYNDGDDTGLLIPVRAVQRGWQVGGFMPSSCPKPATGTLDPEFNRYVSVVYGDAVYHVGGYTRVRKGDEPVMEKDFGWARERMIKDGGAEFMLDSENTYRYKLDREEEVAKEKMQRCFGMKEHRMGM